MKNTDVPAKVGGDVQGIDPVNADADAINRYLHEVVMGKCVHIWKGIEKVFYKLPSHPDVFDWNYRCDKCKEEARNGGNPGTKPPLYTSDDSPRRLLNEVVAKVVEVVSLDDYSSRLGAIIAVKELDRVDTSKWSQELFALTIRMLCLEATAEQIARACVSAHKAQRPEPQPPDMANREQE